MEKYCLLCNSNSLNKVIDELRDSKSQLVYQCDNCNHMQIWPRETPEELKAYYSKDSQAKSVFEDIDIDKIHNNALSDIRRRINYLNKYYSKNQRLLEIGSGYGSFISAAQSESFSVEGFEISDSRRTVAKNRYNVELHDIDLTKNNLLDFENRYDGIVSFHVLEHIIELKQFLSNVKLLTKKNSVILFEVPNLDDKLLGSCESYNNFYWQNAHVSYFNKSSLTKLFKDNNFKIVDFIGAQRYSIKNSFNWILNGKPELNAPTFMLEDQYKWVDTFYKNKLESDLTCDTITIVVENIGGE